MERISLSFSASDNYMQHLAVVLISALEHTPKATFLFHVLTRYVSDDHRQRLEALCEASGRAQIVFHLIENKVFDDFPLPLAHITQEMYYRYLLPELLVDEQRTIYMDVDILIAGDLLELWQIDLGEALLAGMEEKDHLAVLKRQIGMPEDAPYVNSGVLVMDLEKLRAFNFFNRCIERTIAYSDKLDWPDQDVINALCANRILTISNRFNFMSAKRPPKAARVVVRHFANFSAKPWCCLVTSWTWLDYVKYLKKTPFKDKVAGFIWMHIKAFFYYSFNKKGKHYVYILGLRVLCRPLKS